MVSAQGIVLGDAETVGVRYILNTGSSNCPPFRIFYPASVPPAQARHCNNSNNNKNNNNNKIGWFEENGTNFFLLGYLHVVGFKQGGWSYKFLSPIIKLVSIFLSWTRIFTTTLPDGLLSINAPPAAAAVPSLSSKKYPIIIFSHGLTGSGQENTVLLASWAKLGFVVISVHHTDGSSSRVRYCYQIKNNNNNCLETTLSFKDLFYIHGPSFKNYDPTFRQKQVSKRSNELKLVLEFVRRNDPNLSDIITNCHCDPNRVIAAGFSYGATTAVLTAATMMTEKEDAIRIEGLILLDGWFYIDVAESAGIEFEFPTQVFESKKVSTTTTTTTTNASSGVGKLSKISNVFINSQQFSEMPKLYKTTFRLANMLNGTTTARTREKNEKDASTTCDAATTAASNMHVIEGTNHNNFCDIIFWFPSILLQNFKTIGSANPKDAYKDIVRISTDFLKKKNNFVR